ncbi:MAG: response regulator, partial [Gammaproteobacteria bacterium]|nr:response regulator [Gammaproteobacteria bacterium]
MRVLVVEDNLDLAGSIVTSIEQMQHAVDTIDNGVQAEQMLRSEPYDLVVLDLNLPGQDGLQVLKNIRQQGIELPVLILTARADTDSRVKGLDLGADDYLTKPFHLAELDARVRALLRRHMAASSPIIRLGELNFDTSSKQAWHNNEELDLTKRERGVLEIL